MLDTGKSFLLLFLIFASIFLIAKILTNYQRVKKEKEKKN